VLTNPEANGIIIKLADAADDKAEARKQKIKKLKKVLDKPKAM
jgi:hypothetical protein